MKNKLLLSLMALCTLVQNAQGDCSTDCNICSHTTFVPRTMAQNSVLELALHDYYEYHKPECGDCPSWVSLEVTAPYYFKSTKNRKRASFFLPKCQECITVGQNNTSDVSSLWLGIVSPVDDPFQSTICLEPSRSVIGGAFRLFFDLSRWFCEDSCYKNWWLSVFVPVQQVRHNLHITESPNIGGAPIVPPSFANVIDALNNPAWNYGKLSPHKLKKSGVDDICIKLGFDFIRDENEHAGIYGLVFAPTGKGTKAKYLFEPLVGSRHVGAGLGFNADALIYECDAYSVDFLVDARYAYFFKHKEWRSIDLFNGDWSRYLLVVEPTATGNPLPGINFFTQKVEVTPRNMFEVWAALGFNYCNWHAEVGYDFWLHSKEKLRLADEDLGVGIYDIAFNPNVACPISAHCARICQSVPTQDGAPVSDTTFITVKNSKLINKEGTSVDGASCNGVHCAQANQCSYLNLNSAAQPRALSSTVYAAISYDCCACNYPVMIGVGGQYEFAHRISALSQYGVWLKTAISF